MQPTFNMYNFFIQGVLASLPLLGVNKYGFRGFCDFYWPDSSASGSAYVYFRSAQGEHA